MLEPWGEKEREICPFSPRDLAGPDAFRLDHSGMGDAIIGDAMMNRQRE